MMKNTFQVSVHCCPKSHTTHCQYVVSLIILYTSIEGYYRVNYEDQDWRRIIKEVSDHPEKFPSTSRIQLMSDALALTTSGYQHWVRLLEVLDVLPKEREANVWLMAGLVLTEITDHLANTEVYPVFQVRLFARFASHFQIYIILFFSDFVLNKNIFFTSADMLGPVPLRWAVPQNSVVLTHMINVLTLDILIIIYASYVSRSNFHAPQIIVVGNSPRLKLTKILKVSFRMPNYLIDNIAYITGAWR